MVGISIYSPVKYSVYHASKSPRGNFVKVPGRPINIIAVQAKDHKEGDYNPLILVFTVSPFRKDLNTVIEQSQKIGRLTSYSQSLFDSCFKNW